MEIASSKSKKEKRPKSALSPWKREGYRLFRNPMLYHGIFWFMVLVLITLIGRGEQSFWLTLGYEVVNLLFYILIVYFNLTYLIPNYLTQKSFFTYAVLLIMACIILTPLQVLADYFLFSYNPELQEKLLADKNYYFLLTFFIAGSSTIVKIISDWARHQRERQTLETQTMQSELNFLKSQINPHFLFNTLNNLYALTLKKSDKAPEIVLRLSEMMRYMLYECNEKRVLLSKEVNYIHNYLELEGLRQGKKVEIRFQTEGEISEQRIAPLIFIPFIENSFKHGLSNQLTQGFVDIRLKVDRNRIDFFIENSKPETQPLPNPHRRSGGIGLVNVHRRLNLLYPNHYDLHIEDTPRTYAVRLKLELDN